MHQILIPLLLIILTNPYSSRSSAVPEDQNPLAHPFASAFLPISPTETTGNGNESLARRQGCPNLTLLCPSGVCCSYDSSCCGNTCCPSGYLCTGVTPNAPCCVPIGSADNACGNPCERPGDVLCNGIDICCPPNNLCYYDSSGLARCSSLASSDTPSSTSSLSPTPSESSVSSTFSTPYYSSTVTSFSSSYSSYTSTSSFTPRSSSSSLPFRGSTSGTLSSSAIGGIVGGAAGGTIAIIVLILVYWCHRRRRRRRYIPIEDSGIYKSVPLSKDPKDKYIRILEILPGDFDRPLECKLSVVSIGSATFEALSYRWKGAKDAKIHVNGANCLIMQNLASALRYLRHPGGSRFVWCDAICINQNKMSDEKDDQMLLMGKIYRSAETVLIWLGEPTLESNRAMEYFAKYPGPEWCGGLPIWIQTDLSYRNHHEWWLDFGDGLLSTDWWGRTWMVQELVLARKLVFVCGKWQMEESAFFGVAMSGTMQNRTIFTHPRSEGEMGLRQRAWNKMMHSRIIRQGGYGDELKLSLGEIGYGQDGVGPPRDDIGFWIAQFHCWEATDPKDRVYAYLPFDDDCPIQPSKLPKNIPFTELYRLVTEHILTVSGSLDFICLGRAYPRHQVRASQGRQSISHLLCCVQDTSTLEPSLPTWVPDLSQRNAFGANPELPPLNIGLITAFKASNGRPFQGIFENLGPRASQRALRAVARRVGSIKEVTAVHKMDNEIACIEHSKILAGWGPAPSHEYEEHEYAGDRSQMRYTALSRTLVWNLNHERRPCSGWEGFFADVVDSNVPANYNQELMPISLEDDRQTSFGRDSVLSKFTYRRGRRTALLDNDFIGMVPEGCKPDSRDDSSYEVYIFAGASIPMVVRRLPARNGMVLFELVGECYVHGVMYGEVFQNTSVQDVVVTLV